MYDSEQPSNYMVTGQKLIHPPSYRRQLEEQAQQLEQRAADIRKVIETFDKNPELEELLNAMRRLGV